MCGGLLQFTLFKWYLMTIQSGWTAVMFPAVGGETHTVEALIGHGADINSQTRVS